MLAYLLSTGLLSRRRMVSLRFLTLATVVSTALSFVALSPRGSPLPISSTGSRTPVAPLAWGVRGGRMATALNAGGKRKSRLA